jgi:site-specific recombinase XerD
MSDGKSAIANNSNNGRSQLVADNTPVSPDSVFGDSLWNMSALVRLPGTSSYDKEWDFSATPGFPFGFALALSEYAYSRLYKPAESHDRMAEWLTVRNELQSLNNFAKFCASENYSNFSEVSDKDCNQFLQLITHGNKKSPERIRTTFLHIYRLWEYSSRISEPLKMLPLGREFNEIFAKGKRKKENATLAIPEDIFSPLMATALEYVNTYSTSIINAYDNTKRLYVEALSDGKSKHRIQSYIQNKTKEYFKKNPTHNGRNFAYVGARDLYNEVYMLRNACILVILAYSGIRSSELLSLRAGSCHTSIGVNGSPRHYIESVVHKHRGIGSVERWVVINEVHKAVKIIEYLTEFVRENTDDDRLFVTDGRGAFFSVGHAFVKSNLSVLTFDAIVYQINRFQDYCNTALNRDPIPEYLDQDGNLGPWKFNCRQFRRTLARYIARQPFGVIAGMLQYKHIQVTIFEGYAGTEPEWNKMLSEEKVLSNINILDELALDLAQGAVAGNYGLQLKNDFEAEFRGRAEDYAPSHIAKWLANNNKELYVGKFNFCFFDPVKALCSSVTGNNSSPNLNFCSPENCSNACVSKRHSPLWEAQLMQAEQLANHPKASANQRNALAGEISNIRNILDRIQE